MRAIVIALCTFACGGPASSFFPGGTDLSKAPETHYASWNSGFDTPVRLIIRDQTAWEEFWQTMHVNELPQPAVPGIDFTTRMVVAAAMGTRNSGGYSIRISSVSGGTAHVLATSPGTGCIVAGVITHPVDAAVIPRIEGTIRFEESAEVHDC
jgi:PrcB C-terminal